MKAFTQLSETCRELGLAVAARDSLVSLDEVASAHLSVLGGPAANNVAAEVWKRIGPHLPFVFDLTTLSIRIGDRQYVPKENAAGRLEIDYGLIIRLPNPFEPKYHAFLCFGCHGFATAALARFVSEGVPASSLSARVGREDDFAMLVQATLHENATAEARVLETYVMRR